MNACTCTSCRPTISLTSNEGRTTPSTQTPCPFCNGTGEISSFKGVSRFLLTREECPVCSGTGLDSSA